MSTSRLGANVLKKNDIEAIILPAITTARILYLLANAEAMGPGKKKRKI